MERGVPLFIDEVGVIFPKVMTTVFSVMDGRDEIRITANPDRGIVKAQPGFMVLAATNPHAPGVRLSEALLSRFHVHLEVGSDYAMCRELGVPDALVTAAENLDVRRKTGEIGWAPQVRELLRASAQWSKRSDTFAIRNLISGAPEDDREVVAEVLARTTGKRVTGLIL
jgi:nitric oxide reductase NorQ protein